MTEMTNAQLTHEVDVLTEKVRQMENLLGMFMVNGLADAFDGTGNQTFGGGIMRLDKYGARIKAATTTGTKGIYFENAFTGNPDDDSSVAWISGQDIPTGGLDLVLKAFNGSGDDCRISLAANPRTTALRAKFYSFSNIDSPGLAGIDCSASTDGSNTFKVSVSGYIVLDARAFDQSTLTDGAIWYRTDTDKFRVHANSITRNLTMDGTNTAITIATGVVTVTTSFHAIDTEAAAATDDLDTINGGQTGQVLYIHAANSARDVVAKDGTGNLKLAGDFTMNNTEDTLTLIFDGTNWLEISRSDNGA